MNPQHTLLVQKYIDTVGPAGERLWDTKDGNPVTVRANVRSLSVSESDEAGLTLQDTRTVIYRGRQWPGNARSKITFKGVDWDQDGPAVYYDGTSDPFWRITIRRRGSGDGSGL